MKPKLMRAKYIKDDFNLDNHKLVIEEIDKKDLEKSLNEEELIFKPKVSKVTTAKVIKETISEKKQPKEENIYNQILKDLQ